MYNSYELTLLGFFAIAVYVIIADRNVADYILLTVSRIQLNLAKLFFLATFYPRLRYDTFMLKRRMHGVSKKHLDMAKSILTEIEEANENRWLEQALRDA